MLHVHIEAGHSWHLLDSTALSRSSTGNFATILEIVETFLQALEVVITQILSIAQTLQLEPTHPLSHWRTILSHAILESFVPDRGGNVRTNVGHRVFDILRANSERIHDLAAPAQYTVADLVIEPVVATHCNWRSCYTP